uniref:Beta-1,4-N-acetylgalactosaminyltransferase n=1 Tax=Cyclopterus lumpus TaxID=8103 RepID=A0A8C2WHT5_CYCLU
MLEGLYLPYKGRANLHVFEDWCGSSTADLRKNLHYPLYPHSRMTVQKLAISPQRTSYGLRIFGYLHPYTDGEFEFALSSDDNSELWLSTDDTTLNLQLLAWVGKTGSEWTAPGEFEKYASQTSKPVRLSAQKKYFFEVIHKQNDKGTDHVEVALLDQGFGFKVIESSHISLYVDESALLVSDVAQIPQTARRLSFGLFRPSAGDKSPHPPFPTVQKCFATYFLITFLHDVLPDCSYKPSYTIKNVPLYRYQGVQFVHMSFIYPNDYTRLTHIETENSCFYPKRLQLRFARYMKLDLPDMQDIGEQLNKQYHMQMTPKRNHTQIQRLKDSELQPLERDSALPEKPKEIGMKMPLPVVEKSTHRSGTDTNWSQTFQINHLNLQAHRSDQIDLGCNISGNLLLHSSEALPVVKAFMKQLKKKHHGQFTLVRVVNVVKHVDAAKGSRYLLELELKDVNGQLLRLSHYVYAPILQRQHSLSFKQPEPHLKLCNPMGFQWNPNANVHFIVPVKNQARWVQQLIADLEQLFIETGDLNFNLIITDYSSTDMDVKKALQKSSLHRYQYVKLSGNFERAAGLQAGVDLINDDNSIVFLCDLHINFPPFIIDTIRKHCVKGYMAFAPIVLRLDCGVTRLEARGFWEVNGFGLLGIYKSDLDSVGGMNTKEFRDRWGGEDWELLDRILMGGLEVERFYLRNFVHHFHSKRGMWRQSMKGYFSQ